MMVHCENCKYRIKHKYSPYFFKCGKVSYLRGRLVSGSFGCVMGDGEQENAADTGCEYCGDEFVPALNWQYGLDHILPDYKYCPMCGRKMEEER